MSWLEIAIAVLAGGFATSTLIFCLLAYFATRGDPWENEGGKPYDTAFGGDDPGSPTDPSMDHPERWRPEWMGHRFTGWSPEAIRALDRVWDDIEAMDSLQGDTQPMDTAA